MKIYKKKLGLKRFSAVLPFGNFINISGSSERRLQKLVSITSYGTRTVLE